MEDWILKPWNALHDKGAYYPIYHSGYYVYDEMPDWFLEHVKPKSHELALEIGCGFGTWMVPMSRLVSHVAGIDIHPEPLRIAIDKFTEHKRFNCSVGLTPGDSIPFQSKMFDLTYCITVFQHIPKMVTRSYMKEAYRILKPGGRCAFQYLDLQADRSIITPVKDITETTPLGTKNDPVSCGWNEEEVRTAAESIGFVDIRIFHVNKVWLLLTGIKDLS